MTTLKLIIAGPVGAGKTTFVSSLSEIPVVETDEISTQNIGKTHTTVGLDYGLTRVDEFEIHLFGTPGQDRFDFVWEIVAEGAFGLVLLVSGKAPQTFRGARRILDYITSRFPIPFVVGVTHQDQDDVWRPDEVASFFGVPASYVVGLDATSAEEAREALRQMLEAALLERR